MQCLDKSDIRTHDRDPLLFACRNKAGRNGWPALDGVATLYELFEQSVRKFPNNKCLGWRPIKNGKAQDYTYLTYREVQGD